MVNTAQHLFQDDAVLWANAAGVYNLHSTSNQEPFSQDAISSECKVFHVAHLQLW